MEKKERRGISMQLPKNVMQIGDVDAVCKVYIEDYVCTYIKQMRGETGGQMKILLFGQQMRQEEKQYYFIHAAIREGKESSAQKNIFFPKEKQIGYLTCRGDAGTLQLDGSRPRAFDGYYIYYDENEAMQSFLVSQRKEEPAEKEHKEAAGGRFGLDINRVERRENGLEDEIPAAPPEASVPVWEREQQEADEFPEWRSSTRSYAGRSGREPVPPVRRLSGRPQAERHFKPVYLGTACLLLLLCAAGITTLNHYGKMKDMGTKFSHLEETMKQEEGALQDGTDKEDAFSVTTLEAGDTQAADENTGTAGADPVVPEGTADLMPASDALTETAQTDSSVTEGTQNGQEAEEAKEQDGPAAETISQALSDDVLTEEAGTAQVGGIPNLAEQETVQPVYDTYIVEEGDSLAKICRRIYGDASRIDDICELNKIENPDHVVPGQKLLLPK